MIVAIVGDREVSEDDFKLLDEAVKASGFTIDTVVSGGARGAAVLSWLSRARGAAPKRATSADKLG